MMPSTLPRDLSPEAYDLYEHATAADRSPLVETRAEMDAAREIVAARLGTLRLLGSEAALLTVTRLAPGYSAAVRDLGNDPASNAHLLYVDLEIVRGATDHAGVLLASLYGAELREITTNESPWPTWEAKVVHATARDSDHSPSRLAVLEFEHLTLDNINGVSSVFMGRLNDALIWPTGTDITVFDRLNRRKESDAPTICSYGSCEQNPHPCGPYLPPGRADLDEMLGGMVRVTTTPLSLVDPGGVHIHEPLISLLD